MPIVLVRFAEQPRQDPTSQPAHAARVVNLEASLSRKGESSRMPTGVLQQWYQLLHLLHVSSGGTACRTGCPFASRTLRPPDILSHCSSSSSVRVPSASRSSLPTEGAESEQGSPSDSPSVPNGSDDRGTGHSSSHMPPRIFSGHNKSHSANSSW